MVLGLSRTSLIVTEGVPEPLAAPVVVPLTLFVAVHTALLVPPVVFTVITAPSAVLLHMVGVSEVLPPVVTVTFG